MTLTKTSYTHPLRIDVVQIPRVSGCIGMTFCPGKRNSPSSFGGEWNRDLDVDLATIKAWAPQVVVTLIEKSELNLLGVKRLPALLKDAQIDWLHLPIKDGQAPDESFIQKWRQVSKELMEYLLGGQRILIHCRGGLGRTGTVAAMLLIEAGLQADTAMNKVRKARRGTIETSGQEKFLKTWQPGSRPQDVFQRLIDISESTTVGPLQEYGALGLRPIYSSVGEKIHYRTLADVAHSDAFQIAEVNKGGSVPTLAVINTGKTRVLMVGGEEVLGAKQNRVINSTIMSLPGMRMEIPVSCTEQGRWSYETYRFRDAPTFMPRSNRLNIKRAVDETLSDQGSYHGDQQALWDEIASIVQNSGSSPGTGAMRDVIDSNSRSMSQYIQNFAPSRGQKGAVIYTHGEISGLEMFSREDAFRRLLPKILGSYTSDLTVNLRTNGTSGASYIGAFLEKFSGVRLAAYDSPGEGTDIRFEGNGITGSALICRGELIHISAYNTTSL